MSSSARGSTCQIFGFLRGICSSGWCAPLDVEFKARAALVDLRIGDQDLSDGIRRFVLGSCSPDRVRATRMRIVRRPKSSAFLRRAICSEGRSPCRTPRDRLARLAEAPDLANRRTR